MGGRWKRCWLSRLYLRCHRPVRLRAPNEEILPLKFWLGLRGNGQQPLPLLLLERGFILVSAICTQHPRRCRFSCENLDIFKRCNSCRNQLVCRNGASRPQGRASSETQAES